MYFFIMFMYMRVFYCAGNNFEVLVLMMFIIVTVQVNMSTFCMGMTLLNGVAIPKSRPASIPITIENICKSVPQI